MEIWRDFERKLVRTVARGAGKVVARASTAKGARRPMSWVLDEFFLGITDQLEELGVSRRVASGMFGVSRRTYIRQVQGARAGAEAVGNSLWWAILQAIRAETMTREEVLARFSSRPPELVGAILFDMVESGMIEEVDDRLSATHQVDEWSDERLLNFLNMLEGEQTLPAVAELAETLGIDEPRIAKLLEGPRAHMSVKNAEHEALWGLLVMFVEQSYRLAYRELDGDPTQAFVYRVAMTTTGARFLPRLQEIVEAGRAKIWEEISTLLEEHGTREETGESLFTLTMSHTVHGPDWVDE